MSHARDQQIQVLYQAALERPPDERASFVAAVTGDDAQLQRPTEPAQAPSAAGAEQSPRPEPPLTVVINWSAGLDPR